MQINFSEEVLSYLEFPSTILTIREDAPDYIKEEFKKTIEIIDNSYIKESEV